MSQPHMVFARLLTENSVKLFPACVANLSPRAGCLCCEPQECSARNELSAETDNPRAALCWSAVTWSARPLEPFTSLLRWLLCASSLCQWLF